ncbi:MAG: glucokinase [Rhodocyclaceae bacterium]|nr:glucokinase [Rhodocyclaceae bacterium]
MRLCGDIGGTKALLGLVDAAGNIVHDRRLEAADFPDFAALFDEFLRTAPHVAIAGGCLAVAGPIADDGRSARLTNLPWTIDADAIKAHFGLGRLRLVNDFAAAALGVTVADPAALVPLQAGMPLADAPRLVIGAGTGLGMAILVPEGGRFRVLPGEGGHVAFGPADALQAELWADLHARHGRVTVEQVVSGPGLSAIHRFLTGETLDPAEITARAPESDAARRSVDLFLAAYGAFAGDMAMAVLSRGGVFLAGGIIGKLAEKSSLAPFLDAFNAKALHSALAEYMPIHRVTDPALGLKGAALMAID